MKNNLYFFGTGKADGNSNMKDKLGGKGVGLAEMSNLGLNVPSGFTITTDMCMDYIKNGKISENLIKNIKNAIKTLETQTKKSFNSKTNEPLLLSIRSGAAVSMPGMMDTVLNLGLNDETVKILATKTGEKFAFDSYRRFLQMYGNVVLGISNYIFEKKLNDIKLDLMKTSDNELNAKDLKRLSTEFKKIIKQETGNVFDQNPEAHLINAIEAVFKSWNCERALFYRKMNKINDDIGTAVNIQSMVFGNLNDNSGTGVVFTRNPSTGENKIYGEYLMNAQGEDVVAGTRTPLSISINNKELGKSMEEKFPKIFQELTKIIKKLELYYKDVQDIEFTIENGKLFILQTRTAKRTIKASIKIAHDLFKENIITKKEALKKINPNDISGLLHQTLDPNAPKICIAQGLSASPGGAFGKIALNSEYIEDCIKTGQQFILVKHETSPEDIVYMYKAQGILTACGGMTSHAAVVARGIGKPCISGCGTLNIEKNRGYVIIGEKKFKEGDEITIDGSLGIVYEGFIPMVVPEFSSEFKEILKWIDEFRKIKIRMNAETVLDCKTGIKFGAEGIGLARSEHMFFEPKKLLLLRKFILCKDKDKRRSIIENLLIAQKNDFKQIFKTIGKLPVNIRLLDPPLHEFLPKNDEEIKDFCSITGEKIKNVKHEVRSLSEINPMLGMRGCRLGIVFPELYKMQIYAIFEAWIETKRKLNICPELEIMIPLIINEQELSYIVNMIKNIQSILEKRENIQIECQIGTMIEIPRACLKSDELAKIVDYFSFGTNDLTQTTLGISRDDAAKFIEIYKENGIIKTDPFETLDSGVIDLLKMSIEKGRGVKKDLKIGMCGEHGGNPDSILHAIKLGINYVSCSPFRILTAKFAAGLAEI